MSNERFERVVSVLIGAMSRSSSVSVVVVKPPTSCSRYMCSQVAECAVRTHFNIFDRMFAL